MARIAIQNNTGTTTYAEVAIPDAALPKIREVYGATNALAASALLAKFIVMIRKDIHDALMDKDRATREADVATAQVTIDTDFNTNVWPSS